MPRIVPLASVAVLGAALLLAGCAADPAPTSTADPAADVDVCDVPTGDTVESVTVSGDFGAVPTVEFESGLTATRTERAVVIAGDGETTEAGATVQVAYTVLNGTTGAVLDTYGFADGEEVTFVSDVEQQLVGFAKAIGCATVGDRIVAVIPPEDAFGEDGYEELAIDGTDTLVLVIDVEGVPVTRAWGADQAPVDGMPVVTLDATGAPTVELPGGDAPAELQLAVLKLGDGAVVGATDSVDVQYHGVSWDTGEVFDESWPSPTSFSLSGVVPGFAQAIAGQTVGSQVLVVIPPALAYGEAGTSTNALAGQTLVFVIDILGTTPA